MIKVANYDFKTLDFSHVEDIKQKLVGGEPLNEEEADCFLTYLVSMTRKVIGDNFGYSFENRCDLAQSIISSSLTQLNIVHHNVSTQRAISANVEGHNLVVAILNLTTGQQIFLIDPTYQQFFSENELRITAPIIINGMVCVSLPPSSFIESLSEPIIEAFIYKGFYKLTPEFAKIYGDSFLKTKTNIPKDYLFPEISGEIYINSFLKGNGKPTYNDSMLRSSNLYLPQDSNTTAFLAQ